jgi:hypothetical protein
MNTSRHLRSRARTRGLFKRFPISKRSRASLWGPPARRSREILPPTSRSLVSVSESGSSAGRATHATESDHRRRLRPAGRGCQRRSWRCGDGCLRMQVQERSPESHANGCMAGLRTLADRWSACLMTSGPVFPQCGLTRSASATTSGCICAIVPSPSKWSTSECLVTASRRWERHRGSSQALGAALRTP